jgi:hypothetical protein
VKARFFVLLLLTGCSSGLSPAEDYVKRLETVLDISVGRTREPDLSFPPPRDLQIDDAYGQLTIREFLRLRHCKLHTVLAHRNSLIGKVATPSQILFSDLDILATGPECARILDDPELKEKLERFLQAKRKTIGGSLWKALLGQQENRSFWGRTIRVKDYPTSLPGETIESLRALSAFANQVLTGNYIFTTDDYQRVEQHLGQLRFGDGGWLLHEFTQLNSALQHANNLVQSRLARPLCLQKQPTPRARHFHNVVIKFFIQQLQPKAVLLHRRENQLMPAYRALESALLPFATEPYQRWQRTREDRLEQGKTATRRHTEQLQQLFQQCGLSVGSPYTLE